MDVIGSVKMGGTFYFECFGPDNELKWRARAKNLVPNVMLQHMLDVGFSGSTQTATWYVGLAASSLSAASGDTAASHGGWTELTNYDGDRKEYVEVRTNQQLGNTASPASFSVNTAGTVGGAALFSTATGSSGILGAVAALTGDDREVADGDTVNLTYTFSAADS
jgi:hypothetical protein